MDDFFTKTATSSRLPQHADLMGGLDEMRIQTAVVAEAAKRLRRRGRFAAAQAITDPNRSSLPPIAVNEAPESEGTSNLGLGGGQTVC